MRRISYLPLTVMHFRMICSAVTFNLESGWTIPASTYTPPGRRSFIPSGTTPGTPHTYYETQKYLNFTLYCAQISIRESSFNITRGDEDIERGLQKFLDTRKGALKKLGGAAKICILQNQQEGGGS